MHPAFLSKPNMKLGMTNFMHFFFLLITIITGTDWLDKKLMTS